MADPVHDALVAFAEALKDDPSGSDVSREAASSLADALTTPPVAASGDAPVADPAPELPVQPAG